MAELTMIDVEWIRQKLAATPGKTQRGLAEYMGLDPAAISRLLNGQRQLKVSELPSVKKYFFDGELGGEPLEDNFFQNQNTANSFKIPLFGSYETSMAGGFKLNRDLATDWVIAPPCFTAPEDGFAVYVYTNAMEPRYYPGETVFVHNHRPPEKNKDCVVELINGEAHIRRYIDQTDQAVKLAKYNPPESISVKKNQIKRLYAIVGRF